MDPLPAKPDHEKTEVTPGYFRGVISGLLMLILYCAMNVFVDPTGAFAYSGRFFFNHAPPAAAISRGVASGDPKVYARSIRESGANVFLIGPSRTWRGFDTCGYPRMLRLAGDAWTTSQIAVAEGLVLSMQRRPATLLIEVGLPQQEDTRAELKPTNAISVALAPETAMFSLQTVWTSLQKDHESSGIYRCRAFPSPPTDWKRAEATLRATLGFVHASPASLAQGRLNLMRLADRADEQCVRSQLRHRIIFFSLPSTPSGAPDAGLVEVIRRNSSTIERLFEARPPRAGGCDISYANFTSVAPGDADERAMWRDRANWSDYSHFAPRLGKIALRELLKRAPVAAKSSAPYE